MPPLPGDHPSRPQRVDPSGSPSTPPAAALRSTTPDYAALQRPLEHFRGSSGKRLEIHPTEKLLLWLLCIHTCALAWVIGGTRLWVQIPSFVLAAITFVVALLPRTYDEEHTGANRFKLVPWPRLRRFPLFWLGLALLALVAIQALNPAWEWRSDGKSWWMRRIEYLTWLPSGVRAPFERGGPWRMLLIYSTVWLTVCALWVGITRRRALRRFFVVIAVNGLALSLFGLAQQLLGNGKLFWFWRSPNPSFFASFIYKNHAAAFLNLTLAVACGLAGWFYLRGLRRLEKSNPSGVFVFFALCIAVAVFLSFARGATIFMVLFLCAASVGFIVHQLRSPAEQRKPAVIVGLVLAFGVLLFTGLNSFDSEKAWSRLKRGVMQEDLSLEARRTATRASIEMLEAAWPMGAGSGSFRFLFVIHQQHYPEIFMQGSRRMWWEHAHNDIVQFPIELGLAGTLIILAGIGYLLLQLVKSYFWENPLSACVVLGLILLLAYSWWDFPLQNPAVLMLACCLAVAATMWSRLEEANAKG